MKHTRRLAAGLSPLALAAQAQGTATPSNDTLPGAADRTRPALMPDASPSAPAHDNSGINARDRGSRTVTPQNQSQSKGDIDLAASVRRAVVAQPGLSMDGQNIKIITMNNAVTLRGPVKDRAERATIEKVARDAAGSASVDNQLEVR